MNMNTEHMVFVFGSNEAGIHGAGAARFALDKRGAILHRAVGRQGQSYAIPTKDRTISYTLPMGKIKAYVDQFLKEARLTPEVDYQVTQIGCGLAGLKPRQIAPLFIGAPRNCYFDDAFRPFMESDRNDGIFDYNYWGTM